MAESSTPGGVGYLIDALDQQPDLPSRASYVRLLRELTVDSPDEARELTAEEETAIGVTLGAVQLAIGANDYEGLMRAVAAGVQVGMRLAIRGAAEQS